MDHQQRVVDGDLAEPLGGAFPDARGPHPGEGIGGGDGGGGEGQDAARGQPQQGRARPAPDALPRLGPPGRGGPQQQPVRRHPRGGGELDPQRGAEVPGEIARVGRRAQPCVADEDVRQQPHGDRRFCDGCFGAPPGRQGRRRRPPGRRAFDGDSDLPVVVLGGPAERPRARQCRTGAVRQQPRAYPDLGPQRRPGGERLVGVEADQVGRGALALVVDDVVGADREFRFADAYRERFGTIRHG